MSKQGILIAVASDQEGATPRIVTETEPLPVGLFDGFGNPLSSEYDPSSGEYVLQVHDPDAHHTVVNEFFSRHTGIDTTLAIAAARGDKVINVVDATGFAPLDVISVENGTVEATFPSIVSIATNAITLDQPLDNPYGIGDSVYQLNTDMSVDGSVTPVSFKIVPEGGETWHLVRLLYSIVHDTAADDIHFGDLVRLTNGCVLRGYNAATDTFRTLTNWKDNADFKLDMYDVTYTTKSGGGKFGTSGRGSFKIGSGAVPKLQTGDYMELLVQDNLSTLPSFRIKVQGHVEV